MSYQMHSDAEIEHFGHLYLEYRYGYYFVAHDRLSRKIFLGGRKGVPQKCFFFFNFLGIEMLKSQQTIYI